MYYLRKKYISSMGFIMGPHILIIITGNIIMRLYYITGTFNSNTETKPIHIKRKKRRIWSEFLSALLPARLVKW